MDTFVIRRRSNWKNNQELEAAAARSSRVGNEELSDKVRWIRSYIVREEDGRLGSVCIYQATNTEAIREHARRAGLRADEITPVEKTVIVREDPTENSKAA